MQRRPVLGTAGSAVGVALAGCLGARDATGGRDETDDGTAGRPRDLGETVTEVANWDPGDDFEHEVTADTRRFAVRSV